MTEYERLAARAERARRRARFTVAMSVLVAAMVAAWYLLGVNAWATARLGPAGATIAYLAVLAAPCVASVVVVLLGRRDR